MRPSINFYIDVSGQPKDTIFIGLISIQSHDMTNLIRVLKKKDPWLFHRRKKGSSLRPNQIDSIISLLNGLKVRMVCTFFKSKNWNELINYCGKEKAYNKEKIFAALYFQTLKKYSKKDNSYPLTVCIETFIDINKTINYLRKISSAHKINFQISKSQARDTEMLKLADIVAAAGRKNIRSKSKYDFFDFFPAEIDALKYYLKKIK